MLIKEVSFENFRSFKDRTSIKELSKVNVFIGPNGAGKSNILLGLKYLQVLLRGQTPRPFDEMVFDKDTNRFIRIEVCFKTDENDRLNWINSLFKQNRQVKLDEIQKTEFLKEIIYEIKISKGGVESEEIKIMQGDGKFVTILKGTAKGRVIEFENIMLDKKCLSISQPIIPLEYSKPPRKLDKTWRILRPLPGLLPIEQDIIRKIRESMLNWKWLDPLRKAEKELPLGEEHELNPTGSNLAKLLNSILGSDPDKFVYLKNEIVKILPFVEKILAPPRGSVATVTVKEKRLNKPIDLGNISDGIMQTLIMVVKILTQEKNSLLMIEEPELHLHASSQRKLFKKIQEEAEKKNKQFFITTHSTIFTACNDVTSTFLVIKPEGYSKIIKIHDTENLRIIKDILGHRNTDLFGYECVVLIEGDSEETAFPIIAKSMGYDLIERGIRLINVRGAGKYIKMEEFLRYLKDSGVIAYVIADGNKRVKDKLKDWQREGLLKENYWTVWQMEFEDCFNLDVITKALNQMLKEEGAKISVSKEELKELREKSKGRKSIVKIIEHMLYNKGLSLDKPAFAEKIAYIIGEEIKKEGHEKTEPEKVIEKIIKIVESKSSPNITI